MVSIEDSKRYYKALEDRGYILNGECKLVHKKYIHLEGIGIPLVITDSIICNPYYYNKDIPRLIYRIIEKTREEIKLEKQKKLEGIIKWIKKMLIM